MANKVPKHIHQAAWDAFYSCGQTITAVELAVEAAITEYERLRGEAGQDVPGSSTYMGSSVEWTHTKMRNYGEQAYEQRKRAERAEADLAAARAELADAKECNNRQRECIEGIANVMSDNRHGSLPALVEIVRSKAEQLAAAQATIADIKAGNSCTQELYNKAQDNHAREYQRIALALNCHVRDDFPDKIGALVEHIKALEATIAGHIENISAIEAKWEAALTRAGWVRCDGEAGWKPPIGKVPLSVNVQRWGRKPEQGASAKDPFGRWIEYADLLAWERGATESACRDMLSDHETVIRVRVTEIVELRRGKGGEVGR